MQNLLLFPQLLRNVRVERARSQKAFSIGAGLDQGYFCGVERGRRPPLNTAQIERLVKLLALPSDQADELSWAATHDTCVRFIHRTTASTEHALLVSRLLCAARGLSLEQKQGLAHYLQSVGSSADKLVSLAKLGADEAKGVI